MQTETPRNFSLLESAVAGLLICWVIVGLLTLQYISMVWGYVGIVDEYLRHSHNPFEAMIFGRFIYSNGADYITLLSMRLFLILGFCWPPITLGIFGIAAIRNKRKQS
jgi:hypothetical protein